MRAHTRGNVELTLATVIAITYAAAGATTNRAVLMLAGATFGLAWIVLVLMKYTPGSACTDAYNASAHKARAERNARRANARRTLPRGMYTVR